MPLYLHEPQFLVRGKGGSRRVSLLTLNHIPGRPTPKLRQSDSFGTEQEMHYQLEMAILLGYVPPINVSRLRDEAIDLNLSQGSFVEICTECGKHGCIRLGRSQVGNFDNKTDARRVYDIIVANSRVAAAIKPLILKDIMACALPNVPTASPRTDNTLKDLQGVIAAVGEFLQVVGTAARVRDLHKTWKHNS